MAILVRDAAAALAVLLVGTLLLGAPAASAAEPSGSPCVFERSVVTTCASTDPNITFNLNNFGDTSACTFDISITWDSGGPVEQFPGTPGGPDGVEFLTNHTYKDPGVHVITATAKVASGNCTFSPSEYTFTLGGATCIVPAVDSQSLPAARHPDSVAVPTATPSTPGQCLMLSVKFVKSLPIEERPSVLARVGYPAIKSNVNAVSLTIEVDQNGEPYTTPVTVHLAGTSTDGGNTRRHPSGPTSGRPHAWLYQTNDPAQPTNNLPRVPKGAKGGDDTTTGLDVQTDQTGQATFDWVAPEIAGTETVTASMPQQVPAVAPVTTKTDVKVSGLIDMPHDDTLYTLIGAGLIKGKDVGEHQSTHWGTPSTETALRRTAQHYIDNQRNDARLNNLLKGSNSNGFRASLFLLRINDMSLPWGGLFDINGNWTPPHGGHRDGTNADIDTNVLVTIQKIKKDSGSCSLAIRGYCINPTGNSPLIRKVHLLVFQDLRHSIEQVGGTILVEAGHLHITF